MFCSNCGAKVKDGANFCSSCGSKISDDTQDNSSSNYEKENNTNQYTNNRNIYDNLNGKRNFLAYCFFSIITLGIYDLFFWPKYIKDLNIACNDGKDSPRFLIVIILSLITLGIYHYFWLYKQLNRISALSSKIGVEEKITTDEIVSISVVGTFLVFVGWVVSDFFLITRLNRVINKLKYTY